MGPFEILEERMYKFLSCLSETWRGEWVVCACMCVGLSEWKKEEKGQKQKGKTNRKKEMKR